MQEKEMKMKPLALGLSLGIVWGGILFVTTLLSYFTGYARNFLEVIAGSVYPGYTISPLGSVVVFFYGFVDLGLGGMVLGWLYNRFAKE
jgi:hypothetical protein